MKLEEFTAFVQTHNHFRTATNLTTHLHIIEWNGTRILSYFNQPIMVEVTAGTLHGRFHMVNPAPTVCVPFPCIELFCPSFNAKTSMLIDVYKTGVLMCKKQFKDGLPEEFFDYNPKSIKCEPPRSK